MVERYYNKSGIRIPVDVKFSNVKAPAKLKTRYSPKTKEIISNTIQINDKHYKELAKINVKKAKIYLQHCVAHELGHLQRVQDNWNDVRGSYIKGFSNKKEEDYADNYACKLTGISHVKYSKAMDELQSEYDNRDKTKNTKPKVKKKGNQENQEKHS